MTIFVYILQVRLLQTPKEFRVTKGSVLGHCVAISSADDELRFSARHLVEFFDLRAKPRPIFRQCLPPSSDKNFHADVLHSGFSPDGIYYACSRDDNTAQVWDWRWMAKNPKPLRAIKHQPPDSNSPRHTYGVAAMTWVAHYGSSSPPLLVTGGNDGTFKLYFAKVRIGLNQAGTR